MGQYSYDDGHDEGVGDGEAEVAVDVVEHRGDHVPGMDMEEEGDPPGHIAPRPVQLPEDDVGREGAPHQEE